MSKSQSTASRRIYLLLARLVAEGLPHPEDQTIYDSGSIYLRFGKRLPAALAWAEKLGAVPTGATPYGPNSEERDWVVGDWHGRRLTIIVLVPRPKPAASPKPDVATVVVISTALASLESPTADEPETATDTPGGAE